MKKLKIDNFNFPKNTFAAGMIITVVVMLIIPLPAFLLDTFIVLNMIFALTLLRIALHTKKITNFPLYPSLLFLSIQFGLAVNISATWLILVKGSEFNGYLIKSFSIFMADSKDGGLIKELLSFIVFITIHGMLTKTNTSNINFTARFSFDTFQAKQMSVNSEYSCGAFSEKETVIKSGKPKNEYKSFCSMDEANSFFVCNEKIRLFIIALGLFGVILIGTFAKGESINSTVNFSFPLVISNGILCLLPAFFLSITNGYIISHIENNDYYGEVLIADNMLRFFLFIFLIFLPIPEPLLDIIILINFILALTLLIKACRTGKTIDFFSCFTFLIFPSTLGIVIISSSIGLILAKGTPLNGHLIYFVSNLAAGSGEIFHLIVGYSVFTVFIIVHIILCIRGQNLISKLQSVIDASLDKKITELIAQNEITSSEENLHKKFGFYFTMENIKEFIFSNGKLEFFIIALGFIGLFIIGKLSIAVLANEVTVPYIAIVSQYIDVITPYISLAIGAGILIILNAILLSATMLIAVKRMVSSEKHI
jgi:flagellar biosynthesis component FlhA